MRPKGRYGHWNPIQTHVYLLESKHGDVTTVDKGGIDIYRFLIRHLLGLDAPGEASMKTDELDGVAVAPNNHKVIFENDQVRVLETTIIAGEKTPLHTHLRPTVMYVLSESHFVRRDEDGNTMVDTRAIPDFVLPKVLFAESTPKHTIENTDTKDLVVIGVEIKDSRLL